MTSAVKKTTFEEYHLTLSTILEEIDGALITIKNRLKNLPVWHGYKNYGEFIKHIERSALKKAAEKLEIGDTTIRDRWHVLTLPIPIYSAIESGEMSFSKAKPISSAFNFDFENDNDIRVAEEIVEKIISDKLGVKDIKDIKELLKQKSAEVWNKSDIVIRKIVEQHGMTEESRW